MLRLSSLWTNYFARVKAMNKPAEIEKKTCDVCGRERKVLSGYVNVLRPGSYYCSKHCLGVEANKTIGDETFKDLWSEYTGKKTRTPQFTAWHFYQQGKQVVEEAEKYHHYDIHYTYLENGKTVCDVHEKKARSIQDAIANFNEGCEIIKIEKHIED